MGYCPGEKITISATAENHSGRELVGIGARLLAVTSIFHGTPNLRFSKATLHHITTGKPIPPGGRDSWHAAEIEIPPSPPTINSCRSLSLDYYVQVELAVSGGRDLETYFPIIIGSIPFKQSLQVTGVVAISSRGRRAARLVVPHSATTVPTEMPQFIVSSQVINVARSGDQATVNYALVYPYAQDPRRLPSGPPPYSVQPSPDQDATEDQPLLSQPRSV